MKKEHIKLNINEIKKQEKNPKRHNDELIEKSIKEFSYIDDIVIDENNRILSGHGRLDALKKLGYNEIDVIRISGLTENQKERYALLTNKSVEAGGWDFDLLKEYNEEDLLYAGFESEELDKIFQLDAGEDDFDAEAEYEKIKEPNVKLGDLYQLGNHKLLCGDSTKKEDVEKLMGGIKADMVFTDPPYGISVDTDFKGSNLEYSKTKAIGKIINDDLRGDKLVNFNKKWLSNLIIYCKENIFICFCWKVVKEFYESFEGINLKIKTLIVWDRELIQNAVFKYNPVHEFIAYFGNLKKTRMGTNRTNVWRFPKSENSLHPTMKPIEMISEAILDNIKRNQIVLDLFGGSGSTLIACEQLNRKCFMMEIDEKYCDVIINRWEKLTNQKAAKL